MKQPIGIAQVVHSLEIGGMERVALELATGLDPSRWRPMIVCLADGGPFVNLAKKAGIEVVTMGKQPGIDLVLPFRLARLFQQKGIRLIHAHNSGPWFSGTLASFLRKRMPVVVTDHSRPYPERLRLRLIEWTLSHAVRVVSVSHENKNRLTRNLWIEPDRINVIHNGVAAVPAENGEKTASLRREYRVSEEDFVFVSVARLEKQKGFDVLAQAARLMKDMGFRGKILVVGTGTLEKKLNGWRKEYGVEDILIPTGPRIDVGDFYRMADAYVLASRWEGLPMAVLEALSAGLPIVATRVGDLANAVEDGGNGRLVPPEDAQALAHAMMGVATQPGQELAAMRKRSLEIYDDKFRIEAMVRRYEHLYEELL